MICKHCGANVPDGTTFCTNCGQPLESSAGTPVKMGGYLTWAIITTALCAFPFGIPAIINATRIHKCNQQGDFEGARQAAKKSKTWSIVAGILDIIFWLVYIVVYSVVLTNYL